MKIVLTGLSSFTGFWIAKKLIDAGHQIIAPVRGDKTTYEGLRGLRILGISGLCDIRYGVTFGDEKFLKIIGEGGDLIAHHASEATDYRSFDFDVYGALKKNTNNIKQILERGKYSGFSSILFTGSVFEAGEGLGLQPNNAFSPYGISKSLSSTLIEYWALANDIKFGKFIIPNPFGMLEEERFCAYLFKSWSKGEIPEVKTPSYIRDNIPIQLLADAYVRAVIEMMTEKKMVHKFNPSGYVGSQRNFIVQILLPRVNKILNKNFDCAYTSNEVLDEPLLRINSQSEMSYWTARAEDEFWTSYINFYRDRYSGALS